MSEGKTEGKTDAQRAEESREASEAGEKKVREMEESGPPEKLEDWPTDEAKYTTFGGGEGGHGYDEGPETKLGPSGVRHHEDGSVSIDGEQVDNPEDYKGEPIPGGPTDPDSPKGAAERSRERIMGAKDGKDDESGDDSSDDAQASPDAERDDG